MFNLGFPKESRTAKNEIHQFQFWTAPNFKNLEWTFKTFEEVLLSILGLLLFNIFLDDLFVLVEN